MSFQEELLQQGLYIPYSQDTSPLAESLTIYGKMIPNRIAIQPLEGYDSGLDGSPTPYVYRRYLRFAEGGAGLVWFEACAVSEDGKSNPHQMMLRDSNVSAFHNLLQAMDNKAAEAGRASSFKVLQLTHSGRMSRNDAWKKRPLSPKRLGENDTAILASDERIAGIVQEHIHSAELAAEAGFDAVDIKICHGYFLCELLSAFQREGKYGGSFENRTRALFEIIDGIRARIGNRIGISVRMNAFDSEPYPDGFGIKEQNGRLVPDLSEAIQLCRLLKEKGVRLVNVSASAPAARLFDSAPIDPAFRKYGTPCDYLAAVKILKQNISDVCFMCTGLSSFGAEGGAVGAGGIRDQWFDLAGFGKQALAYPSFASDLLEQGKMDPRKCCTGCEQCFTLMDPGCCRIGCIVRDKEEFFPLYKERVLSHRN